MDSFSSQQSNTSLNETSPDLCSEVRVDARWWLSGNMLYYIHVYIYCNVYFSGLRILAVNSQRKNRLFCEKASKLLVFFKIYQNHNAFIYTVFNPITNI